MVKLKIIKAGRNTHCVRSPLKIFDNNIASPVFAISLGFLGWMVSVIVNY
jgi:hypothetical protein